MCENAGKTTKIIVCQTTKKELVDLLFLHGEEYLVEGIATQGSVKG